MIFILVHVELFTFLIQKKNELCCVRVRRTRVPESVYDSKDVSEVVSVSAELCVVLFSKSA